MLFGELFNFASQSSYDDPEGVTFVVPTRNTRNNKLGELLLKHNRPLIPMSFYDARMNGELEEYEVINNRPADLISACCERSLSDSGSENGDSFQISDNRL